VEEAAMARGSLRPVARLVVAVLTCLAAAASAYGAPARTIAWHPCAADQPAVLQCGEHSVPLD
jgi:hypothetical protein